VEPAKAFSASSAQACQAFSTSAQSRRNTRWSLRKREAGHSSSRLLPRRHLGFTVVGTFSPPLQLSSSLPRVKKRSQRGPKKEDVLVYSLDFDFILYLPHSIILPIHLSTKLSSQLLRNTKKGNKCG